MKVKKEPAMATASHPVPEILCSIKDYIRWGASRFTKAELFFSMVMAPVLHWMKPQRWFCMLSTNPMIYPMHILTQG